MGRDSSPSMVKSTYLCQKLIYALQSHDHVFKTHLIGSKPSLDVPKTFNRFKNFPLILLKHLISSKPSLDVSERFNQLKASKTMNTLPCSLEKHLSHKIDNDVV